MITEARSGVSIGDRGAISGYIDFRFGRCRGFGSDVEIICTFIAVIAGQTHRRGVRSDYSVRRVGHVEGGCRGGGQLGSSQRR